MQWNLIILRKEHELSQREMAEVIGINVDTYGHKERGQLQFTMDEMFLISDFFNKPIHKIFLPRKSINNARISN